MAEEMTPTENGNFDASARWARLSERVESQGKDIIDLRSNMNTGFSNIQAALTSLASELRGSTKTQWPVIWSAIGVSFAILLAVGSQALSPIRDSIADLKAGMSQTVSRQEMDWRSARGAEDRLRQDTAISDLRDGSVTRLEWAERNRARDTEVADLSRRVDEIRADFGAVYGTRDVIQDLQEEVDRLRQRFNERPRSSIEP